LKTFDLSPDGLGFSKVYMIDENVLKKLLSKCGKYISRIIYKHKYYKLRILVECEIAHYISTYCFNVTSLDLTALAFFPWEIEILAKNCNKIIELRLKFHNTSLYEKQLTKLFEVNENLEHVALFNLNSVCSILMNLPEHKMKAITFQTNDAQFFYIEHDILFSVNIIQFFLYLILIIDMFLS